MSRLVEAKNVEIKVAKKFDPAPVDKYAQNPKKALEADLSEDQLDEELAETFPASDPLSAIQPKPSED
ncbi:hypothetical protein RPMA_03775 [Tardiphaga alba]|uniref:Uncharacterized protein n=1 Tax=Tardiphaga alba TaxID=340268 RepID=A0ABX8A3A2_9BRAD|nr:hypothetical protein [Tardiphaga alba]QUS38069.1 hypothetical protein RPMA_03775 [Tardiphaga alba]